VLSVGSANDLTIDISLSSNQHIRAIGQSTGRTSHQMVSRQVT